ncbi:MAG TPA: class I SAM-dependent methyltransferase [Polyangia bacterium]
MAKNWTEAQENEQSFWTRWAGEQRKDQPAAARPPITVERAVDFARVTLERFNVAFRDLDGKTVADIGCGPYGVLFGILNSGERFTTPPRLIGVDPLMDLYERIGLLRPQAGLELHKARGETIPLPDGSCDFVWCINALDHVENPGRVAAELHRITKSGGVCGVSLHTVTRPFAPVRRFLRYVDKNHPHHLTLGDVRGFLAEHFDRVELSRIVTLTEDQPAFAFHHIFDAKDKKQAIMQWISTLVLHTACFTCRKE